MEQLPDLILWEAGFLIPSQMKPHNWGHILGKLRHQERYRLYRLNDSSLQQNTSPCKKKYKVFFFFFLNALYQLKGEEKGQRRAWGKRNCIKALKNCCYLGHGVLVLSFTHTPPSLSASSSQPHMLGAEANCSGELTARLAHLGLL